MATETGTVELPPQETTDEQTLADTQTAIFELLNKDPQKSDEPETPASPEQPPQETETTSEPEPEAPAAETEDEHEALAPEVQASVDKRIGKEVAKRKELEEQLTERAAKLTELEAKVKELTEAPKEVVAPNGTLQENDPLLQVPEINAVAKQESKAREAYGRAASMLRLLSKDPDAAVAKLAEDTKQTFTADEAREWLENAKDHFLLKLNEHTNNRHAITYRYQQRVETENSKAKERFDAEAIKAYPWLKAPESKEGKVLAKLLKEWPGLRQIPNGSLIAADLVTGIMAREAKAAAPAAPAAPPPRLATNGKTAAPVNGRAIKPPVNALRAKAEESGDIRDIAKYLEKAI